MRFMNDHVINAFPARDDVHFYALNCGRLESTDPREVTCPICLKAIKNGVKKNVLAVENPTGRKILDFLIDNGYVCMDFYKSPIDMFGSRSKPFNPIGLHFENPPCNDHGHGFMLNGQPAFYLSQPYDCNETVDADMRRWANYHNLVVKRNDCLGMHCPSRVAGYIFYDKLVDVVPVLMYKG